ncbi:MAG: HAD family hydrolase [SAR202 cluster bacterium]|jgi:HAD superfamily hydrolase (TIGR01509 family)|nr:HAD family hydrolase [SAR202 cluster bacterium]MDP6713999.1 HAD family hydrolase [SAR202 cluster bacterium]
MSRQIDAVIFDLDGTLVDSQPAVLKATKEGLARFGVTASDDEVRERFGGGSRNIMSYFLVRDLGEAKADEHIDEAVVAKNTLQTEYSTEVAILPGVEALLGQLKQDGFKIAIATMGAGDVARRVLSHNRVDSYFEVVLTADDVTNPKPDPEILEKATSQLGVQASRSLYVGDSTHDLGAAKAVGMPFVLADTGLFVDGARRIDLRENAQKLGYPVVAIDDLESIAEIAKGYPSS